MKTYMRKNILISPHLQGKIIGSLFFLGTIVIIINLTGNYLFLRHIFTLVKVQSDAKTARVVFDAWQQSLFTTTMANILVLVVFVYFGLLFSHRMAGPVFQITSKLARYMSTGKFEPIQLRETDFFKDLADQINKAFEKKWDREEV